MQGAELEDADLDFVIDASQEWQCQWWGYEFRVTPDELRAAVREVGSSANAVREYFATAAALTPSWHAQTVAGGNAADAAVAAAS